MRYVEAIRRDPEARKAVDVLAIHGYADDGVHANRSPDMWQQYYHGRTAKQGNGASSYNPTWTGVKADNKPLWMTEVSGEGQNWDSAIRVAQTMQDGITKSNVGAWVFWGIANSTTQPHGEALTQGTDARPRSTTPSSTSRSTSAPVPRDWRRVPTTRTVSTPARSSTTRTARSRPCSSTAPATTRRPACGCRHRRRRLRRRLRHRRHPHLDPPAPLRRQGRRRADHAPGQQRHHARGSLDQPKPATVSGFYYKDRDADKKFDPVEVGLPGDKVFIDANRNGRRDAKELFAVTDAKATSASTRSPPAPTPSVANCPPAGSARPRPSTSSSTAGKTRPAC
jgi:hypothetical protein